MKNIKYILPLLAISVFTACASKPARVIDSKGPETIISLDRVDIQDFSAASDAMIQSMINWEAFKTIKNPRISLDTVTNDTTFNFDVAILTDQIMKNIMRTGKARISMARGANANASMIRNEEKSLNAATAPTPDFALYGKISELSAKADRVKQVSYIFSMTLVDPKTGDIVWTEQKTITKQGEKAAVGF